MSTITTIQASDKITDSRAVINNNFDALNNEKIETSYLDNDTTLAANSDSKIPTQKAVKAYIDSGGNPNASTTQKGVVEEATAEEVAAGTAVGSTGARLFVNPSNLPAMAMRVYTGNATWTKPAGLRFVIVEVQAGGGGGGDPSGNDDSTDGGDSSFGSLVSATGGKSKKNGSAGGAGSGGDINISGENGQTGFYSTGIAVVPRGGASFFGKGSSQVFTTDTNIGGGNGIGYGSGGGGGKTTSFLANGGGGGGYARKLIPAASLGATEAITVGAAGARATGGSVTAGNGVGGVVIVYEF